MEDTFITDGKEPLARVDNLLGDGIGYLELIDSMGNDNSIVASARISYLGESKGRDKDKKLLKYMIRNHHTSPFESVIFQFRAKCPLFTRSQWFRHRTWSFSEVSRRYTSEELEFYIPKEWRMQDTNNKQGSTGKLTDWEERGITFDLNNQVYSGVRRYNHMIEKGVAREQARMVLPQNMYTTFYGTVDLHNLMHFIRLRSDEHSQWEIQQYSNAMKDMIKDVVPVTYDIVYNS